MQSDAFVRLDAARAVVRFPAARFEAEVIRSEPALILYDVQEIQ